jgi:hypothetical protein
LGATAQSTHMMQARTVRRLIGCELVTRDALTESQLRPWDEMNPTAPNLLAPNHAHTNSIYEAERAFQQIAQTIINRERGFKSNAELEIYVYFQFAFCYCSLIK